MGQGLLSVDGVRGYNIFHSPDDYPGKFVVRGWTAGANSVQMDEECELCDSLEEARSKIPPGFVWLPPHATDVNSLVEVWVTDATRRLL